MAASPQGPQPSPPQYVAVPGGSGALRTASCSAQDTQAGSSPCQLSLTPSHSQGFSEWLSGSASPHLGLGATICHACYSSAFHPNISKTCPEASCGTQISAPGLLPPDWLTSSSIPGPQPGCGTPNGAYMAVPGSRPPCPSAPTAGSTSPCPAWAAAAPWGHTLGPRQHHHGGAEDARGGTAVPPSSAARGLRNPLLPVLGSPRLPAVTHGTGGPACGRRPCWATPSCPPAPGWPHRTPRRPPASWPGSSAP